MWLTVLRRLLWRYVIRTIVCCGWPVYIGVPIFNLIAFAQVFYDVEAVACGLRKAVLQNPSFRFRLGVSPKQYVLQGCLQVPDTSEHRDLSLQRENVENHAYLVL